MVMMIRLLLIVSLITQLVWSMECCGVVVLRPDLVADEASQCAAVGACASVAECCESQPMSCCDEAGSTCEVSDATCGWSCEAGGDAPCDRTMPCKAVMCSPLEQKKPSAAAMVIDFVALVAHPLIPSVIILMTAQPQTEPVASMILKCNHVRQAWLEVWRN
jgi:hypothetical protein